MFVIFKTSNNDFVSTCSALLPCFFRLVVVNFLVVGRRQLGDVFAALFSVSFSPWTALELWFVSNMLRYAVSLAVVFVATAPESLVAAFVFVFMFCIVFISVVGLVLRC